MQDVDFEYVESRPEMQSCISDGKMVDDEDECGWRSIKAKFTE